MHDAVQQRLDAAANMADGFADGVESALAGLDDDAQQMFVAVLHGRTIRYVTPEVRRRLQHEPVRARRRGVTLTVALTRAAPRRTTTNG